MAGGSAGIALTLAPHLLLDVGYRYLQGRNTAVATRLFVGAAGYTGPPGPNLPLGATKAHIAALGLTFRF